MANSISGDNFSTPIVVKGQKSDTRAPRQETAATVADDRADVNRAQHLLTQNVAADSDSAIRSGDQARERVAALVARIQADPTAATRAQGRINPHIFEAASARPTA